MGSSDQSASVRILSQLPGIEGLANDVLYHPCRDATSGACHLLVFGGDVQDLKNVMMEHRDNWRYVDWCLENMCQLLSKKFVHAHVWLVRPNEMFQKTFAAYRFIPINSETSPEFSSAGRSIEHLANLLQQCEKHISSEKSPDHEMSNTTTNPQLPIILLGFSKGCSVLNQVVYELVKDDTVTRTFADRIQAMYWLDGGHAGGKNTWVTSDEQLAALARRNIKIRVHVTPYQMSDPIRSWNGKEERRFVSKLRKLGADIQESLHFEEEPRSLDRHFQVIEVFLP